MENPARSLGSLGSPKTLPRIGVSACLLGERVRYDGGNKYTPAVAEELARFATLVPVCPEFELGLGVPRETLELRRSASGVRLVFTERGEDITERMRAFRKARIEALAREGLHGFVLKSRSPSCGLGSAAVVEDGASGSPARTAEGTGLFAQGLVERFPLLPMVEETELVRKEALEGFLERAFAYLRWSRMLERPLNPRALTDFHARHKMALLARDRESYRRLGRLAAEAGRTAGRGGLVALRELFEVYGRGFFETLAVEPTPGRHADVLQHLLGCLRGRAPQAARTRILKAIEDYRSGGTALETARGLLREALERHGPEWARSQTYLRPFEADA